MRCVNHALIPAFASNRRRIAQPTVQPILSDINKKICLIPFMLTQVDQVDCQRWLLSDTPGRASGKTKRPLSPAVSPVVP